MKPLDNQKEIKKYILLFSITYMISYMTRINYGAIVLEIEHATQMPKTLLSMALTGCAITYGVGQIISGIFGDRISPKKLITYGLIVTVCMNTLIPFCQNHYQITAVWCVNGFAQAFMWPPLVRIMSTIFTMDDYKTAAVKVSCGSSVGTILVYLISPLLITTIGWKSVFWCCALCGACMIWIWNRYCCYSHTIEQNKKTNTESTIMWKSILSPVMIGIMFAIVLQGMLRDGVTTWLPTYISETYHLNRAVSILTSVILPIFSIISFELTGKLYRKYFKNPLLCAGVIFGAGAVSALALLFITGHNTFFSLLFSALLTASMHGVNVILISMIPPFFQKTGNVSTVSGVLNSCTYIGSAISTYGTAMLAETFNWNITVLVWMLVAALGTITCIICVPFWAKKHGASNQ